MSLYSHLIDKEIKIIWIHKLPVLYSQPLGSKTPYTTVRLPFLFRLSCMCVACVYVCSPVCRHPFMCMCECTCVQMHVETWSRHQAPSSAAFPIIHWGRVAKSNPELAGPARLTSPLARGSPASALQVLELQLSYHTHPAFLWVLGTQMWSSNMCSKGSDHWATSPSLLGWEP